MESYVSNFHEIDRTRVAAVGGKGANLGELARVEGVRVPEGFCVTTDAYRRILADATSIDDRLDRLSRLTPDDREAIRALGAELRETIEAVVIPDDIVSAIVRAIARLGDDAAYAVRSSATAEDSATASFAGQQDSYLNVVGQASVLRHVGRCWASLFTERAVTYRLRNGIDHRAVTMAVVVQRMLFPDASGVMFTADPVSGHRKITSVEAVFDLGEALVSGTAKADAYTVRDGTVVAKSIAAKRLALEASPEGGTRERDIEPERQEQPVLSDEQVVRLATLGRRIEAHFGSPQDVEWCLVDGEFHVVQSRPITTLFPIPEAGDSENHVYISVGHHQMMTDPMKPLGLSLWQMTTARPMAEAGGRLFVDVTQALAAPASRAALLGLVGRSDPLIGDALRAVLARGDFVPSLPDDDPGAAPAATPQAPLETDPAVVAELIARVEASVAAAERDIRTKTGTALLDFIVEDIQELKRVQFDPRSFQAIMAGMEAAWWLNERLEDWLGEKNPADALTQSVPHNVTSEMGLALLDVADAIRPHPDVVAFLERVDHDDFMDRLAEVAGGREARDAVAAWLDRYGMRGVGEIDVTRPRWSERPSSLVPLILGNVRNFEPGEGARRFERGLREAETKRREVLERLRALPDGERKAEETERAIDRVRTFAGYREYPKYGMICRYFVYKLALLDEAERLVRAGVLREKEDVFNLRFDELREVVRVQRADDDLIRRRKDEHESYRALTPPRVLTSDGESVAGSYRRDDVPPGALVGLAVSAGTVEGRARVVVNIEDANLEAGDILVTAFTDPSWTPVFVTVAGLVTEVGGLMSHGSVIAREYGLPAVVGVEQATKLVRDGQRIRVHGSGGFVELLS